MERDYEHSIFYIDVSKGTSIVTMGDKVYPVGLTKEQLTFYPICISICQDPTLVDWVNSKLQLDDNVFVSGKLVATHKIRVIINGKKQTFNCIIVDGTDVKSWNPRSGFKQLNKLLNKIKKEK